MKRVAAIGVALVVLAALWLWSRPAGEDRSTQAASERKTGERSRAKRLREIAAAPVERSTKSMDAPKARGTASIAGHVRDRITGAPVARAELAIADPNGASRAVVASEDGSFLLDHAAAGVHVLQAITAKGYLAARQEELWALADGDRLEGLTLLLTPEVAYRGLVLDAERHPVLGATVRVLGAAEEMKSDAKGTFAFHARDEAVVEARHPNLGMGRAIVGADVQITHAMTIVLDPKKTFDTRAITGIVIDVSGHGVAAATVSAAAVETLSFSDKTQADREGRFHFDALDEVTYVVNAFAEGYGARGVSVEATDVAPLRIVLGDACPVDLAVQGVENTAESSVHVGVLAPVPGRVRVPSATVTVLGDAGLAPEEVYESTVVPDGRGRATISGFGPGHYLFEIHAGGFSPAPARVPFVVPEGCGDVTLSATLGRGFTLRGEVLEEGTNAPLAWALVNVEASKDQETRTNEQGQFELRGIATGMRSFFVSASDHNPRIIGPFTFSGAFPERVERVQLSKVAEGETPKIELAGIGVAMSADKDELVISTVLPNAGADHAGMKIGDRVTAVDGVPVTDLGFDGAMQRIRGPVGSEVRLSVIRAGQKSEITVTRTKIKA